MYIRKRLVTHDKAMELVNFAEKMFQDSTYDVSSKAIMRLAGKSSCSAYDLEFISLAIEMDVPLVTIDKQVLREFPKVAVSPTDFL